MAITNLARVGKAMELRRVGLQPSVERDVQSAVKTSLGTHRVRRPTGVRWTPVVEPCEASQPSVC